MVGRRIWRRSFAVAREDVSSPYESGLETDGCGAKVVREQGEKVQRGAVVVPGLAVGVQVRGCVYRSVVVRWGGQRRSLAAKLDEARRVLVVVLGGRGVVGALNGACGGGWSRSSGFLVLTGPISPSWLAGWSTPLCCGVPLALAANVRMTRILS
ncbi:hypothetical protein DFH11DRAFT_1753070 [Phellopilus nigrolimitatus]|nr:hypothetical protein DFH11DRAFT_1753070 [Phellopilus nigrolimitatus]